jgi:hypothetical protein
MKNVRTQCITLIASLTVKIVYYSSLLDHISQDCVKKFLWLNCSQHCSGLANTNLIATSFDWVGRYPALLLQGLS